MRTIFTPEWMRPGREILLASQSPRRIEILKRMGIAFEPVVPMVHDEGAFLDIGDLERSLERLAHMKAQSVARHNPDALVLGADTIVVSDATVLGKPRDEAEARDMLKRLSGRSHRVYTGVSLVCEAERFFKSAVEKTIVVFRDIEESEIEAYLALKDYGDKAGAYAIQGSAMVFVERIEGCFSNVVGLPVVRTISLFNAFLCRKEPADV